MAAPLEPFLLPSEFPLRVIEQPVSPRRSRRHYSHRHEACEITCIRSEQTVYEVRGREFLLEAGDVLVTGPLEAHGWHEAGESRGAKTVVLFDASVAGIPQAIRGGVIVRHAEATALVNRVRDEDAARVPGYQTIITAAINRILVIAEEASFSLPTVVQRALTYMRLHYHERITAADVAEACRVSAGHLAAIWRQEVGTTPARALRELRVRHGLELLTAGAFRVPEVAAASGFGSVSAFERAVVALHGVSPRAYVASRRHG